MSCNSVEVLDPGRIVEVALIAFVHATSVFHESLQAVGQVVVIAVIELLLVKKGCQTVNVWFVGLVGVRSQRDELNLVDLVDQAMVDLTNHKGFCHNNEIFFNLQLHDAIDCIYGYFLHYSSLTLTVC